MPGKNEEEQKGKPEAFSTPKPATQSGHTLVQKQDSVLSNSGGGIALSGRNKLSLGFYSLNADFALPEDFNLIKKLGKGAYG